jgi:hypothetical protein
LHHSDAVNIVDVASNSYDNFAFVGNHRLREFVVDQGIDFIFEQFTRMLKIRVRYSKVNAERPIIASTLNLNASKLNRNRIVNNRLWVQHIVPGTYFARAGEMVQVARVHGDSVFVTPDDSGNEEVININEAAELLAAYIG